MNDVHGTHGTPSVVEHPFTAVGVESDDVGRVGFGEVGDDVVNHVVGVIRGWGGGDRCLREFMEVFRSENVPPMLITQCLNNSGVDTKYTTYLNRV